MRLIDADAFDKMLIEAQAKCKKNGGSFRFGVLGNVRANLALFPTVDRPEIVRCKDCNECYFASNRAPHEQSWACGKHGIDVTPNWFCADGERK